MTFRDHFSAHAADYGRYRPTYPPALFAWLAAVAPGKRVAWDCATGNGQAATGLAPHFETVIATDASEKQLAHAVPVPNVTYRLARSEQSGLPDRSTDLVTVAQAIHWFEFDAFYAEVRRVARPGGLLAAWTYVLLEIDPEVDAITNELWGETLKDDWPPERRYVDEAYRTLPFPFEEVQAPAFEMEVSWDLDEVVGYLSTWSAVRKFVARMGYDPLEAVWERLEKAWGDPAKKRRVRWPVILRVGRAGRG